jgi:uncharacterized protein YbjT (DUF2867 family)
MRGAVIAGATGMTGQQVLNRLLDDGGFDPVVAVLRRPFHRSHPRLRERIVDFNALAPLAGVQVDVAVCCLGTTIGKAGSKEAFRAVDYGHTLAFARWVRAHGAQHFLFVSSVAADLRSPNFYLRVKAETERDLEGLGFRWLDIFRPSFLLGHRQESRPGERVGKAAVQALEFLLAGPLERFRGVSASTLSQAMLARAVDAGEPGVRRHEWSSIGALAAGSGG